MPYPLRAIVKQLISTPTLLIRCIFFIILFIYFDNNEILDSLSFDTKIKLVTSIIGSAILFEYLATACTFYITLQFFFVTYSWN